MRVLVTGANGCIGAWVVKNLVARGIDVLLYDNDPSHERLSLILSPAELSRTASEAGAIEDTEHVKRVVRDGAITHIVHLAAVLMPFCQARPVAGAMVNVIGTLNVFEAARDAGRPVRIVYASSAAIWGPEEEYAAGVKLDEEQPARPTTHYGVFKQANEAGARVFFAVDGISSIGLRPWTVYGLGRDRGLTADPTLAIKALALGEPFRIRLTGKMDFQYVEDVAEAFIRCLLSPLVGAYVFNLEGSVVDISEFIQNLERLRAGALRLVSAEGPQVPVACRPDGTQLRAKVPDLPQTPLIEGINRTLAAFDRLRAEGRLMAV